MSPRIVLGILTLSLSLGSIAAAAPSPSPSASPAAPGASLPTLPPSATSDPYVKMGIDMLTGLYRREQARNANSVRGTVSYFKRFDLQVTTGTNAYRNVKLHQGTVINPRGASIQNGQTVDVSGVGHPDGSIDADTITVIP